MRLSQIGKEQAVQKDAAHLAQTLQGSNLVRESEEHTRTVNQTRELEDGPEAIKDEQQQNRERREENRERKETESEEEREIFHDPDLGSKIDITG